MRTKYIDMLAAPRKETEDNHKVNNYLFTMKQIIVKCKFEIKMMVDVDQGDLSENKDVGQASVYSTQIYGSGNDSRGRYNSHRGYRGSYYNKRGRYQSSKDNRKPINLDERGNYLWDSEGKPLDASKDHDEAFTLHSSSLENDKDNQGRGAPRGGRGSGQGRGSGRGSDRGSNRGSDRGRGFNKGSGRGSNRGYGSGQRGGRGTHYNSKGQPDNRHCTVCNVYYQAGL